MSFLPKELASAQEWLRVLELPAHDVAPLVELGRSRGGEVSQMNETRGDQTHLEREVAVRANPLGIRRVHRRLACGANGNGLSEIGRARLGHPSHLGSKVLNVVLIGTSG